jgi:protein-tyrosine phosphatase
MIDMHSHVLPGIDDGPATPEGSLEILRSAEAAGITTLLATPHVNGRYRNDSESIAGAYEALQAALGEDEPAVEIMLGAEVAVTRIAELDPERLAGLCLGEGPWLLVEPPFSERAGGIDTAIAEVHRLGYRVLLAHPERCPVFHRDPQLLERLVDGGVLTSLTSGSLVGRFGSPARQLGLALLDAGLAHNVASDAHDVLARPPSIASELAEAGRAGLEDWLTREVPGAILSGAEIPRRPSVPLPPPPRRRWLRRG